MKTEFKKIADFELTNLVGEVKIIPDARNRRSKTSIYGLRSKPKYVSAIRNGISAYENPENIKFSGPAKTKVFACRDTPDFLYTYGKVALNETNYKLNKPIKGRIETACDCFYALNPAGFRHTKMR